VAEPVKGDVVVIPFPFSDLSQSKRRPALVLAALEGDDVILLTKEKLDQVIEKVVGIVRS